MKFIIRVTVFERSQWRSIWPSRKAEGYVGPVGIETIERIVLLDFIHRLVSQKIEE
jgi:hypothetical protein